VLSINTDVLKTFRPWAGTIPSGYFAYFLGNLTRADYWKFSDEVRKIYDCERYETFSGPSIDDNIFDWVILLETVASSKDTFVMAALGAGWGRWLVAGALACKQRDLHCELIGVEAEPDHFAWMNEHFRDNGLDPAAHELIEAAAAGNSGQAWFYFGKPASWYGQSLIRDPGLKAASGAHETEYEGERARLVRTIDLAEITQNHECIDYLHMDIQGAELEVLAAHPNLLQHKVKRVLIGTHSPEIECGLRGLFKDLEWRCEYDIPLYSTVQAGDQRLTLGDGVQVWINPHIVHEPFVGQSTECEPAIISTQPGSGAEDSIDGLGYLGNEIHGVFDLGSAVVHNNSRISGTGPVVVQSDTPQWSYAVGFRLQSEALAACDERDRLLIRIDATVSKGCIGALFVADDLQTVQSTVGAQSHAHERGIIDLVLNGKPDSGWLILRNNSGGGDRSECQVNSIRVISAHPTLPSVRT
jgi:FkbM family methyltransferase